MLLNTIFMYRYTIIFKCTKSKDCIKILNFKYISVTIYFSSTGHYCLTVCKYKNNASNILSSYDNNVGQFLIKSLSAKPKIKKVVDGDRVILMQIITIFNFKQMELQNRVLQCYLDYQNISKTTFYDHPYYLDYYCNLLNNKKLFIRIIYDGLIQIYLTF